MVTVWWSATGVVHCAFLKHGGTVTAEKYCGELHVVGENLSQWSSSLVNRKGLVLLYDSARPHLGETTLQKLNSLGCESLPTDPIPQIPLPRIYSSIRKASFEKDPSAAKQVLRPHFRISLAPESHSIFETAPVNLFFVGEST